MNLTIRAQATPETEAMLQAAYSRSHTPIQERVANMDEEALKASLKQYYLGYGHASINQTAFVTIYIEGVSIIAAKCIQDDQLYNGQESSTRYIPFDRQPLIAAPVPQGNMMGRLIELYRVANEKAIEFERLNNPDMNERGIKARAFDYTRSLLPAGVTTQLSWTTSLYSAREGCMRLMTSVYPEVCSIAKQLWAKLHELFPNSFEPLDDLKLSGEFVELHRMLASTEAVAVQSTGAGEDEEFYYAGSVGTPLERPEWFVETAHYHWEVAVLTLLRQRTPRTRIPRRADMLGTIYGTIPIDYACWRDLQRHRSAYITNPVFRSAGLHKWYVDKLTAAGLSHIVAEVESIIKVCSSNYLKPEYHYHMPLGAMFHVEMQVGLASAIYIAELRGKNDVHPILRDIATSLGSMIEATFKIPVALDSRPVADRSNSTLIDVEIGDGMQG